jgi:hypothetical protein
MADPREDVAFDDIDFRSVTYLHDDTIVYNAALQGGSAQVGLTVTLESNKTVSLIGDGESVEGRLIKVEPGGIAVVNNKGYVKLPRGTGATLTPGKKIVGDLLGAAEGYVREVATATAAELGVARGRVIDSSAADDGDEVVVEL